MLWSKAKHTQDAELSQSERKDEIESQGNAQRSNIDEAQYPGLKTVLPVVLSVCGVGFLTALVSLPSWPSLAMTNHCEDRTIVGVAVPTISNEFNSFGDISWYESAYLLTFCAFQLPMGKIYVC